MPPDTHAQETGREWRWEKKRGRQFLHLRVVFSPLGRDQHTDKWREEEEEEEEEKEEEEEEEKEEEEEEEEKEEEEGVPCYIY